MSREMVLYFGLLLASTRRGNMVVRVMRTKYGW